MSESRPPRVTVTEAERVQETVIHVYVGSGPSATFMWERSVEGMRRVLT
jgi:hypothetical protein